MFGFTEIIRKTYSGDVKIAIEIEIPRHRLLPGSAAAQDIHSTHAPNGVRRVHIFKGILAGHPDP